jgi:hypothetical protein
MLRLAFFEVVGRFRFEEFTICAIQATPLPVDIILIKREEEQSNNRADNGVEAGKGNCECQISNVSGYTPFDTCRYS